MFVMVSVTSFSTLSVVIVDVGATDKLQDLEEDASSAASFDDFTEACHKKFTSSGQHSFTHAPKPRDLPTWISVPFPATRSSLSKSMGVQAGTQGQMLVGITAALTAPPSHSETGTHAASEETHWLQIFLLSDSGALVSKTRRVLVPPACRAVHAAQVYSEFPTSTEASEATNPDDRSERHPDVADALHQQVSHDTSMDVVSYLRRAFLQSSTQNDARDDEVQAHEQAEGPRGGDGSESSSSSEGSDSESSSASEEESDEEEESHSSEESQSDHSNDDVRVPRSSNNIDGNLRDRIERICRMPRTVETLASELGSF